LTAEPIVTAPPTGEERPVLRGRLAAAAGGAVGSAVLGALCIASSGVLVRLADVSPSTAAAFRCLYAVPMLAAVVLLGRGRHEPRPLRSRLQAGLAGVLLSVDLVLWHHGIVYVGAGLATVLGNLQVVVVAGIAWAVLGEHPGRSLFVALPVVLAGVVLISGVVGSGAYGSDPALGAVLCLLTSVAYSLFLLVHRHVQRGTTGIAGPLLDAVVASAATSAVIGAVMGDLDVTPSWPAHGWLALLALTAQVAGWLLISRSLTHLPAALTSMLLLIQPVGALALAMVVVDESPSAVQLAGSALILAGVVVATAGRDRSPAEEPVPRPAAPEAVPAAGY
jgi:drug/metabolite transporter (DMT)-like permease